MLVMMYARIIRMMVSLLQHGGAYVTQHIDKHAHTHSRYYKDPYGDPYKQIIGMDVDKNDGHIYILYNSKIILRFRPSI